MAEFKINDFGFNEENTLFRQRGVQLNDGFSPIEAGSLGTLSTSQKYIDQHTQIKDLIRLYISLVQKDYADLDAMRRTAESADEHIAGFMRK